MYSYGIEREGMLSIANHVLEEIIKQVIHVHIFEIEMQQYIDISPYHDTLGSDTVSIHI